MTDLKSFKGEVVMTKNKKTYLKMLIDAEINIEESKRTFIFQKERIGLKSEMEIQFIKEIEPTIEKEVIVTNDEVMISAVIPKEFQSFKEILKEDDQKKWIFAHQLIEKVQNHPYKRLTPVVCPGNIVFDAGMTPYFIHYGILDRLPPFAEEPERIWLETKAVIATVIDNSKTFDEYVKYHEALDLNAQTTAIMNMADRTSLLIYIKEQLELIEKEAEKQIHLPLKKWRTYKYGGIALGVLFVPAIIFILYTFIYEQPRNQAYLDSHEAYLKNKYSEVVNVLSAERVKHMPYIVLYELAYASVINERLDEEQKKNVLNNITLQTDEEYFKYWIQIGRGEAEKAINLGRLMEDGELITYGLLKRREEIQAQSDLTGEEKERMLKDIDEEVEAYEKLMIERQELEDEERKQQEEKLELEEEEKLKLEQEEEKKKEEALELEKKKKESLNEEVDVEKTEEDSAS